MIKNENTILSKLRTFIYTDRIRYFSINFYLTINTF